MNQRMKIKYKCVVGTRDTTNMAYRCQIYCSCHVSSKNHAIAISTERLSLELRRQKLQEQSM